MRCLIMQVVYIEWRAYPLKGFGQRFRVNRMVDDSDKPDATDGLDKIVAEYTASI